MTMVLVEIYLMIAIILGAATALITISNAYIFDNWFHIAFYVQCELWNSARDECGLNVAGRIILVLIVSVFVLPTNLMLLTAKATIFVMRQLWRCFVFIFKERSSRRDEEKTLSKTGDDILY